MFHIKYREDFNQIESATMKDWLQKENPYIPKKGDCAFFIPDENGWLVVLEKTDSIDNLNTGVAAIDDIHGVIYWEFALFNSELNLWLATVILTNGFGMSVAIPDSLITNSPLRKIFSNMLEP